MRSSFGVALLPAQGRTVRPRRYGRLFRQQSRRSSIPEYSGKPLIVGADPRSSRGVVSTCSYEARAYGVRSAMPIREAYRRCPHAIFVRPDMPTYVPILAASEGSALPLSPRCRAALHRRGLSRHDGVRALLSFPRRTWEQPSKRRIREATGPHRFRRHRAQQVFGEAGLRSWKARRPRRRLAPKMPEASSIRSPSSGSGAWAQRGRPA